MAILRIFVFIAAVSPGVWAQAANQPLTDAGIESMLAAGLPESTILLKIQTSAYLGLLNLDASPEALATLKQMGASERLLNAVVGVAPLQRMAQQAQADIQAEQQAAPNLPDRTGVYFKNGSRWTPLASFLLWPPFYSGWNWVHAKNTYAVPLNSAHAAFQTTETRPSFYLRSPASLEGWRILHLTAGNDRRLLRAISSGGLGQQDRIDASQVRDGQFQRLAGNIFTVQPLAALDPGEYALCVPAEGGPRLSICYAFGVQR
jgi:hypothetical protein